MFSANIRLCLCAQISQLFLFLAPLHPQVTTEGVLEPPAVVTVGIFAAPCSLPVLWPGHQDSRHPRPCPAFRTFKPCSWASLSLYPCSNFYTTIWAFGNSELLDNRPGAHFQCWFGVLFKFCVVLESTYYRRPFTEIDQALGRKKLERRELGVSICSLPLSSSVASGNLASRPCLNTSPSQSNA